MEYSQTPPPPATFIPTWIKLDVRGELPEERVGTRINYVENQLLLTGGDRTPGTSFDVFSINLDTLDCSKVLAGGIVPTARDSHTSILVGQELIIVGGTDGQQKFNQIYSLNTLTKVWSTLSSPTNSMPSRECHTTTPIGTRLYTFGGLGESLAPSQVEGGSSNYLSDTWCLDLETKILAKVQPVGECPQARDSHAAAAFGNSVIIIGGDAGDRYLDDVWQFNTTTSTWRRLTIKSQWAPGPCAGHTAVSLGDNAILVYGGVTSKRMEKDVWVLYIGPDQQRNLVDGEAYWDMLQVTDGLPPGRYAHASDYGDGCFFIAGGVANHDTNLNDCWVLALTQQTAQKMLAATQPPGGGQLAVVKRAKRDDAYPKKITSYNIFCSEMREQLRTCHPELASRDIEKMMGQRWGEMNTEQKKQYEEKARTFNAHAVQTAALQSPTGLPPPKKMKAEKANHMMNAQVPAPATTFQLFTPNPSLIGANVEGNIDAVFNAGYLATVKVNGFTYRALLFSPYLALSVPVSVQPTQGANRNGML